MFGASYTDHDQGSWPDGHPGQQRSNAQPSPPTPANDSNKLQASDCDSSGGEQQPEPYVSFANSTRPVNGLNPAYWRRADERPHGLPLHHSVDFDCCVWTAPPDRRNPFEISCQMVAFVKGAFSFPSVAFYSFPFFILFAFVAAFYCCLFSWLPSICSKLCT